MDAGPFLPFPTGVQKTEKMPEVEEECAQCLPEVLSQGAFCFNGEVHQDPVLTDRANSEENITFISESMTVTSSDEEKLQLLNKNTELRRLNKELIKLNQEWDRIYHTTTQGMQQEMGALHQQVVSLQQQMERLSIKLEQEQEKRECSEQTLLQELKKNQHLQEFIRHLESKLHHRSSSSERRTPGSSEVQRRSRLSEEIADRQCLHRRLSCNEAPMQTWEEDDEIQRCSKPVKARITKPPQQQIQILQPEGPIQEKAITELKEQLNVLKCQTEIYRADYKNEHKDRQRITVENQHLRKKEEEMRQQVLLLQEQLKIYEDDFRKERSDKQVLQRLLKNKANPTDPLLVHRCNNENHEKPLPPFPIRTPALSPPSARCKSESCNKHCASHSHKRSECPKYKHLRDVEVQASPFSIDYK
uniref:Cytadherence high molecular weight protein 2-like n=1 Tax=Geotrypetes seraphini TaxID=260995 RepID=A0A6P8QRQ4_GEOSA|nr:cytadherence high molecular weight protein 2-like [Geotrypetes seraphini]XP_033799874.1 cytadherence high molecular weight protein 2-like [Geotrypetes seraphini]